MVIEESRIQRSPTDEYSHFLLGQVCCLKAALRPTARGEASIGIISGYFELEGVDHCEMIFPSDDRELYDVDKLALLGRLYKMPEGSQAIVKNDRGRHQFAEFIGATNWGAALVRVNSEQAGEGLKLLLCPTRDPYEEGKMTPRVSVCINRPEDKQEYTSLSYRNRSRLETISLEGFRLRDRWSYRDVLTGQKILVHPGKEKLGQFEEHHGL